MAKGGQGHHLAADMSQVIEQLERHCLAPDGSYISKSAYSDLQLAREEMSRERTRYLEAVAIYSEAIAMVEEYQQALSVGGGTRDVQGHHPRLFGMMYSPQVYESLEHRLVVAEAAQRLRLPLLSRDGETHEEEIEKWSSLDSTGTSVMVNSCSNSTSYANISTASSGGVPNIASQTNISDLSEPGVGGVRNRFLGITADYLWQVQQRKAPVAVDETQYQRSISHEIEARLEAKCDKLADALALVEIDSSPLNHIASTRLPERVKFIIEEIEREETFLLEDLYSMDRKFAEHYSVLEQILGVLIKFVKDLKLQHQHKFDELRKDWLCKRCQTLNAKLRCLEYLLLCSTYTKDSVPALHRVREYLLEATTEASIAYNKAVTRLREYQGVDPHFDTIAMEYHDIVKKLESMQWTIHQVEMDLRRSSEHPSSYVL